MSGVSASSISDAPSVTAQALAPAVRKYFPETWIWNCVDSRFVTDKFYECITIIGSL